MNDKDNFSFGQNLKKYRELCGLSQQELSGRCGCSVNTISELETSKNQPKLDIVKKLARAMDISLDQLAFDAEFSSDDYYIKEALMVRGKMSEGKRRMADILGIKVLEEVLALPDDLFARDDQEGKG